MPATVIFDDPTSFIHAAVGFTCVITPPWVSLLILLLFIVYQLAEAEDQASKEGDFLELSTGLLLGLLVFYGLSK